MGIPEDPLNLNIKTNQAATDTLFLILKIERRQKYLWFSSAIFLLWAALFIPIALYYISIHPDRLSQKVADVVLGRLLSGERVMLNFIPTDFDKKLTEGIRVWIGGADSDLHWVQEDILGLNYQGLILFYLSGLSAILFAERSLKLSAIGKK